MIQGKRCRILLRIHYKFSVFQIHCSSIFSILCDPMQLEDYVIGLHIFQVQTSGFNFDICLAAPQLGLENGVT